jgi:hypothetical protein
MNNQELPERTCIVCREKGTKDSFFRIVEDENGKYTFDKTGKAQKRGSYICKSHECLKRLSKHKKYNLSMDDLMTMLGLLKKTNKDYLGVLRAMKNSDFLTFGINMLMEDIEQVHFIIIAEDISEKNEKKVVAKAKEKSINYVHYGSKSQLGEIFGKDEVNVVGIKNKKIARGLTE